MTWACSLIDRGLVPCEPLAVTGPEPPSALQCGRTWCSTQSRAAWWPCVFAFRLLQGTEPAGATKPRPFLQQLRGMQFTRQNHRPFNACCSVHLGTSLAALLRGVFLASERSRELVRHTLPSLCPRLGDRGPSPCAAQLCTLRTHHTAFVTSSFHRAQSGRAPWCRGVQCQSFVPSGGRC